MFEKTLISITINYVNGLRDRGMGHISRMPDKETTTRRGFDRTPAGTRPRTRLRIILVDKVYKNFQYFNLTCDYRTWMKFVKMARTF